MLPLNLVSVEGFEPPTLCSQSRCATGLRYTLVTGAASGIQTHDLPLNSRRSCQRATTANFWWIGLESNQRRQKGNGFTVRPTPPTGYRSKHNPKPTAAV